MAILKHKKPLEIKELIEQNESVLVDIFGDWCHPCKMLAEELIKLDKKHGKKLIIIKIDNDKETGDGYFKHLPFLKEADSLGYVPILYFFKKGKKIDEYLDDDEEKKGIFSGYAPMESLEEILVKHEMI